MLLHYFNACHHVHIYLYIASNLFINARYRVADKIHSETKTTRFWRIRWVRRQQTDERRHSGVCRFRGQIVRLEQSGDGHRNSGIRNICNYVRAHIFSCHGLSGCDGSSSYCYHILQWQAIHYCCACQQCSNAVLNWQCIHPSTGCTEFWNDSHTDRLEISAKRVYTIRAPSILWRGKARNRTKRRPQGFPWLSHSQVNN